MNAPPNGRHTSPFDSLSPLLNESALECRSRFDLPLPNGGNGADALAPPLPIGGNGADPFAPPLPNGGNGAVAFASPLPIGVNGHSSTATPPQTRTSGRDKNGRFLAGNPGGPGNPFTRRTAQLRRAFCEAVSEEEIKALALVLLHKAKEGDWAAAKLLSAYAIGKPVDVVDPDTLDVHEWQHFQQVPARADEVGRVLNSLPVEVACDLIRIFLPVTEHNIRKGMLEKMEANERKLTKKERRKAARAANPTPTNNPAD